MSAIPWPGRNMLCMTGQIPNTRAMYLHSTMLQQLEPDNVFGQGLKGLGHAILGNFSTDQMVIK